MTEHPFRPWKGRYLVNDIGEVYSTYSKGTLSPQHRHHGGYVHYSVRLDGKAQIVYAHTLVLETFVGPRPPGYVACHLDGNPKNNSVTNLMWGTVSLNLHHAVQHGVHFQANKTHCPQGHPYDEANTNVGRRGDGSTFRQCRECHNAAMRQMRARHRFDRHLVTPCPEKETP